MKTNYKIGDKVRIIKNSKFKDLEGVVITNNTETKMKPLSVDLSPYGSWSFEYEDVSYFQKEATLKEPKTDLTVAKEIVSEAKRKYIKKDKTKPVKEKRPYNRKAK